MRLNEPLLLTLSAASLAVILPVATTADQHEARGKLEADVENWSRMQEQVVSAEEILGGEVTNGFNMLGQVRDIVLTPEGDAVQYVLYEVPYPYSFYGAEDGFVKLDNVAFETAGDLELNVRIDEEEKPSAAEELKLTRGEADHRMVTHLIEEPLQFSGEESREIEDLLIDRKTGEVAYYVIDVNEDSLFNEEPRTVPAERVEIDPQGTVTADLRLEQIEDMQAFAPDFLK